MQFGQFQIDIINDYPVERMYRDWLLVAGCWLLV